MLYDAVPAPMQTCPQWLLWRAEWRAERNKWDKIPYSPVHYGHASTDKPQDWSGFENTLQLIPQLPEQTAHGKGPGFVFGYESGMYGVDLDNVFDSEGRVIDHNALEYVKRFNSYTEYSPSGRGLHIIAYGIVAAGRRHKNVEIYGQGRYFTVTGRPYLNVPIRNCQAEADALIAEIDELRAQAKPVNVNWSEPDTITDQQLWQRASTAENGEKFIALFNGQWQQYYPSASEGDLALINILAFYTDSPMQVRRGFEASHLYKRSDKYVRRPLLVANMIERAFDRKVPTIDLSAVLQQQTPKMNGHAVLVVEPDPVLDEEPEETAIKASDPYTPPPGAVGAIAEYIYNHAPYPLKEGALAAALALMAGICGRQFQFKGKGLNLYLLLLANTGSGKEAMQTGLGKIMDSIIRPEIDFNAPKSTNVENEGYPSAAGFRGPADLTGKGILRMFTNKRSLCSGTLSCFCLLPEFAHLLQQMADPRNGNSGIIQFKRALLDLYMKSSTGNMFAGTMNASAEEDIVGIPSPALTILGEATPNKLAQYLNEDMITDGMLPRMIIFETDKFGEHNPDFLSKQAVPTELTDYLRKLCKQVMHLRTEKDIRVEVTTTPEAEQRSEQFRKYARQRLTDPKANVVHRELWNRAHLNAERIAALIAIGINRTDPVVSVDMIDWAARLIERQIVMITGKFKRGEVGTTNMDDKAQFDYVLKYIKEWLTLDPDRMPGYLRTDKRYEDARRAGIIPYYYLQNKTSSLAPFRHDKRGATNALRATIDSMIRAGTLAPTQLGEYMGTFYRISL